MLDIFKSFATDTAKEQDGVWEDLGGGARILVARSNNRKYIKLMEAKLKAHKHTLDAGGEAAEKVAEEAIVDSMAKAILLDWQELSWQGAPLEVSEENAKKLLGVKDFRAMVMRLADDRERFLAAEEEEAVKN